MDRLVKTTARSGDRDRSRAGNREVGAMSSNDLDSIAAALGMGATRT